MWVIKVFRRVILERLVKPKVVYCASGDITRMHGLGVLLLRTLTRELARWRAICYIDVFIHGDMTAVQTYKMAKNNQ